MSTELFPLSDWRSTAPHVADDCNLERCRYCGCCVHGKATSGGCVVQTAPLGMHCPVGDCCCEGNR